MHNGMLQMGEEKMAKSVGNVAALHAVLDRWGNEALLMYFSAGHYRQPIAFDDDAMAARDEPRRGHPRGRAPARRRRRPRRTWPCTATRSSTRWPTTSTPRAPSRTSRRG